MFGSVFCGTSLQVPLTSVPAFSVLLGVFGHGVRLPGTTALAKVPLEIPHDVAPNFAVDADAIQDRLGNFVIRPVRIVTCVLCCPTQETHVVVPI